MKQDVWLCTKPPNRTRFLPLALLTVATAVAALADGQPSNSTNSTNNITNATHHNEAGTALGLSLLQEMEEQDRLTTPFSQRDTILQLDQSRLQPSSSWSPCVVQQLLQSPTIHVWVTGGSSAARPGNGCSTPTDPYAGRYSNLLERQLNQRLLSNTFRVTNLAQGAETSVMGALALDARLATNNTDLIIWDYSINDDSNQGGHDEETRKLDFWLTRLALQMETTLPPPIILLYLWQPRAGNRLQRGTIDTLDQNPMAYIGVLIEKYRALGWEIAVVNVGGAVNSTFLKQDDHVWLLFDDPGHPSCRGTQFIADLIEHTLWSNLAGPCTVVNDTTTPANSPAIPPHAALSPNIAGFQFDELWEDLFDSQTTIGSISPWQPRIPNQSNLNYTLHFNESSWPLEVLPMHTQPTREDRKLGYQIPRCHEQEMTITLHEPTLQWIGLSLRGELASIRLRTNHQTVPLQDFGADQWDFGRGFLSHWIPVSVEEELVVLSFCHESTRSDEELRQRDANGLLANLQFLIGVALPKNHRRG